MKPCLAHNLYANIITTLSMTCCSRITLRNVRKHVTLTQKLSSNTYFKPPALRVVYHRTGGFVRHVIYNAHLIIIKNKPMSDLRSLIEELKACTTNNLLTNQDDVINPRRACTVLGLRALVCLSVCQLPHFLKIRPYCVGVDVSDIFFNSTAERFAIYSEFRYISRIFPTVFSKLISIFIRILL